VLACVRTERVQLNPLRSTEHLLPAVVKRIVYRGTDYEATCSFGAQEVRAVVNSVSWDASVWEGSGVLIGFGSADVSLYARSEESQIVQYSSQAV
jgi:hypothetical protein